jgi:hypothetical protein
MKAQSMMVLGLLVLSGLTGCRTLADVTRAKDEGTSQIYSVDADQAWKIAMTVFRWEGSDAIEEHRAEGYMLTSSGATVGTMGAVMGAWIDPVIEGQTKVTVVTKRRVATNLFTTLTETTFHRRFAQAVKIVKAGKPLPLEPPGE